ncbi:MAG: patatin-like phospholipase family protein [Chloroflexota bacterium]
MTNGATQPKHVALVIGSGSVKCAAAIGLYNVLQRAGIGLDMVVGCSGGSMYAALMALGDEPQTIAEITSRLWTREVTSHRNVKALLSVALPQVFGFDERFGLVDDKRVMQRLREAFGERTFADARTPLYIAATDFMNGEQVVLREGRLVDAIRASIAIPNIFKPHRVGERLLVDGYLSDPLPIGVAIREGANVIVAMGFESPYQSHIGSFLRFSFQVSGIMANNLLKANFAFHNLAHHSEVILLLPEFNQRIGLFDTDKIPYIIDEGERCAEAQLPYLRKLLNMASEQSGPA